VQELPAQRVGITNGLLLKFPIVYAVGELALIERPRVAIVGARKATPQGQQRAAQLARDLARAGIVVVSGLAEGIDRVAHETALAHGGKTIAVVGTPLDKVYPYEHASLQEEIYRHHLLVSPFRWGDRFYPSNFPERNRVMARLALATVIVEASDTSGSLHQAAESVTVGHNVFIARSVAEDAKLKWPGRFIGKPHATVLESSKQVIEYVAG
jgi:DNA processing protein